MVMIQAFAANHGPTGRIIRTDSPTAAGPAASEVSATAEAAKPTSRAAAEWTGAAPIAAKTTRSGTENDGRIRRRAAAGPRSRTSSRRTGRSLSHKRGEHDKQDDAAEYYKWSQVSYSHLGRRAAAGLVCVPLID